MNVRFTTLTVTLFMKIKLTNVKGIKDTLKDSSITSWIDDIECWQQQLILE